MEYFEQLLGIELGLPARFIIAFVVVMVLIALTATAIRGFSGSREKDGGGARGGSNRRNRLHIGEWINLDDKRRLVLVRRDDVEHLLLIGGNSDLVVERDTAGVKPATVATIQTRPALPDILEPPEQPKAPAIDIPYRSALRPGAAATDTAVLPEPAPPAAPGLRPSAAFGEMGARLQREVDRARGTPKAPVDREAESAASEALAQALDLGAAAPAPHKPAGPRTGNGVKGGKDARTGKAEDNLEEALIKELSAGD